MNKGLLLLLAITLLLPFQTMAEEELFIYRINLGTVRCIDDGRSVSEDVSYENGIYQLIEPFNLYPPRWDDSLPTKLYCLENNKQDEIYLMFKNTTCILGDARGKLAYKLTEGNKDLDFVYFGTEYQFENGSYILTEYEEIPITQVRDDLFFYEYYKGYYMCLNYGKTCSTLYMIGDKSNSPTGSPYSTLENVENYFLVSDTYKKENGQFVLINPRKVYLSLDGGEEGYSCRSHDATCSVLYTISTDERYDRGRRVEYNELSITNRSIDLELEKTEGYDLKSFFTEQEIAKLFSLNPEIAEIKNNQLVLKKAGTTDIIYEDNTNYKVIHLRVLESLLEKNPKTNTTSVLTILLGTLLIISLLIEQRRKWE